MSRIAVVTSHPPFSEGGHLVIARELVAALKREGHESELVLTPQNSFGRQGGAYLATWLTDVVESQEQKIDQVISLRFPSYAVRHERHVCWMLHTMREYYDMWPQFQRHLSWRGLVKERVRRRIMHTADWWLLRPDRVERLFALSETVRDRLLEFLALESLVLYPPPPVRPYRCDGYSDYFFTISRATVHKRLDLPIRALAEPAARGARLVVGGDGPTRPQLERLARELGVADRVQFVGKIDDAELLRHYAECRAVCFTPWNEDFGFVTAEAFASRKAVITTDDSGGPAELVVDGEQGIVTAPTPAAVAAAMARFLEDPAAAEHMGAAAERRARVMSWADAVHRLVVV